MIPVIQIQDGHESNFENKHFNNNFQLQHLGSSFSKVLGPGYTNLMLLSRFEVKLRLKDTMSVFIPMKILSFFFLFFFATMQPRMTKSTMFLKMFSYHNDLQVLIFTTRYYKKKLFLIFYHI